MLLPVNDDTPQDDPPAELRRVPIIGQVGGDLEDADRVRFYRRPAGYVFLRDGQVEGLLTPASPPLG